MRILRYFGFCSIVFVLCHTLILTLNLINHDLFKIIQYHHSNSLTWYLIYFIGPTTISLLAGLWLYKKFINIKVLSAIGIINLTVLLTTNILVAYMSHDYWGYAFRRPAIFSEAESALKIINASTVYSVDKNGQKEFVLDTSKTDDDLYGREDPYYGNRDRIFMTFQDNASKYGYLYDWHKILTDSSKTISKNTLNQLTEIIYSLSFIEPGEGNWDTSRNLRGEIIEFITEDSVKYYYSGLSGGQVANDHFPFYEFLFTEKGGQIRLEKKNKHFYDVAGIEGLEYSTIEPIIMTLVFIILLAIYGLTTFAQIIMRKNKNTVPNKT